MPMLSSTMNFFHRNRGRLALVTLLLLFLLLFFFKSIFITVYPGEMGVKFNRLFGGTVVNRIYPDGFYVIFPWDKLYTYDVRIQGFQREVSTLSSEGLYIGVDIAVRFHLDRERLPYLHLNVGPEYMEKVVIPISISSVRQVVGRYQPEGIYSLDSQKMCDDVLIEVINQTGRIPIIYDSLVIERITLPDRIKTAIENKLRHQQELLAYKYRIEAQTAEIRRLSLEAEGIAVYNDRIRKSLSPELLTWAGVKATSDLASSNNAKLVIVGGGKNGLPVILNMDGANPAQASAPPDSAPEADGAAKQDSWRKMGSPSEQQNPPTPESGSMPAVTPAPERAPTGK